MDGIQRFIIVFLSNVAMTPQVTYYLMESRETKGTEPREIFESHSAQLGVQFMETDNLGLQVVTGDMRALDPDTPIGPQVASWG